MCGHVTYVRAHTEGRLCGVVTEQMKTDEATRAVPAGGETLRAPGALGSPGRPWPAALAKWLRSALFRPAVDRHIGWRHVLGAAAFLVAGSAVALARTEGPGALNTTWIEDASIFLQDALHKSVMTTLTTPNNGYYNTVPRMVTAIAMVFPLRFVPGIMSACAALVNTMFGLVAYTASGPHLRSRWLRLLVAAPVCAVPLGYTQSNDDLATLQFIALYGTFWLLLWVPATRAGRVASPVIMLGVTLSSILPVMFAPLVAARLIADRSRNTRALAACWAAGLLVQYSVQLRGMSGRNPDWFTSPLWALGNYVTRVAPRAIFGELALGGSGTNGEGHPLPLNTQDLGVHTALVWGAWGLLAVAVVIGLTRLTAPHWALAVTALLSSVLVFVGEIVDNLPIVQPRYVIAPALLLYTAIIAALRPRGVPDGVPGGGRSVVAWTPVAVFALLLAVVCGFNFRVQNNRSESPPWTAVVAAAERTCMRPSMSDYIYKHAWWTVQIPCGKAGTG